MKTIRALLIGGLLWGLGVTAFIVSFFIPVLENPETQANLVLFITVVPLTWWGSKTYYQKGLKMHGSLLGFLFFGVAGLLDACITVPFLVIPQGGSYGTFFGDPGFWVIGLLFIGIPTLYWVLKVKRSTEFI